MEFDKIWEYQNEGIPSNKDAKNQTWTTYARPMKFSE